MDNPKVTVVILTTKEAPHIPGLADQTYKNFEVVLANEPGIVNAMNRALERATGEIFVRIDDDVELSEGWLEQLLGPFDDPFVGGVTGPTFVPKERRGNRDSIRMWENPGRFLRWLADNRFAPAAIHRSGCVSYDSNYRERFFYDRWFFNCDHLEGTNWAMRTDLIRKVGGFDPAFDGVSEWIDTDVEQKVKKLGYHFVYNRRASLYHLLEKGPNYQERFDGWGRIKNFLRFHWRHARWRFLNFKFYVYLIVWMGYFILKSFQRAGDVKDNHR